MAAGFKTATVASGDVPATQTNFPAYVDLSRLGITTLAEAQSVRVYADSGKTTEWAREIVSATEMWTKIPSLTSTTEIFVDWDGSSADYAATDTYGRNAVWSGYEHVYHLYEGSGATINDSTGNSSITFPGSTNDPAWTGSGQIGNGLDFDGSNDFLTAPFVEIANNYFFSGWVKIDSTTTARYRRIISTYESIKTTNGLSIGFESSTPTKVSIIRNNAFYINASAAMTTNWTKVSVVIDGSNGKIYYGATQQASASFSVSSGTPSLSILGAEGNDQNRRDYFPGLMDEVRIATFSASADWISTEYNNQSDEAGFWGTWSDVGGGGSPDTTKFFALMH